MRLVELAVRNFRGFGSKADTIRLDRDLVLFFGPNGFGFAVDYPKVMIADTNALQFWQDAAGAPNGCGGGGCWGNTPVFNVAVDSLGPVAAGLTAGFTWHYNAANINWAGPVFILVMGIVFAWYGLSARKWFKGPQIQGDEAALKKIEAAYRDGHTAP